MEGVKIRIQKISPVYPVGNIKKQSRENKEDLEKRGKNSGDRNKRICRQGQHKER